MIPPILSPFQSGFRKQHSTVTAAMKVFSDIIDALDCKKNCSALFLDLSKAFDTVDHGILLNRLSAVGLSENAIKWFANYLSERTQCVRLKDCTSSILSLSKGVPQGSVLGPILFSLYINNLCDNIPNAKCHLYADDTAIYCCASSASQALHYLQLAFDIVQFSLCQLKLVLNTDKTSLMIFSNSEVVSSNLPDIISFQGTKIEYVVSYKYLGILFDSQLTFKLHIDKLLSKLKLKLRFYYTNGSLFSLKARKYLYLLPSYHSWIMVICCI